MKGHRSPISGVAASPDGRYVCTAGYDNRVYLWDTVRKTALAVGVHDHLANQCTFSPDGRFLATASSDHTCRLWRVPDLKLLAVCAEHEDDAEMVAFNPAGDRLATASRDHKARVFDLTGRLLATLEGHGADVISVAWSTDGGEVMTSSDDGTVRVWDARTGRQRREFDMHGVETDTLVIGDDGTIYAGDDEGRISVLGGGSVTKVPAHRVGVKRLALGGGRLVSLSYDRTFTVWRVARGGLTPVLTAEMPPVIWPRSCAFHGADQLVFGTFGTCYATFNLATKAWDLSAVGQTGGVNAVAWMDGAVLTVGDAGVVCRDGKPIREVGSLCNFLTPFGRCVLTGGQTGRVFDALTGEVLYAHRSPLNCGATYAAAGQAKAVVGSYTGEVLVFGQDAAGRAVFERAVKVHANAIKGLACDPETIFSVCATGAAAWHSTRDCGHVRTAERGHDKIANGCATLAGYGFASVSRDRKLRTWAPGGRAADVIDTPHTHSIKCVSASPDGRYVATASYNGRAAVYDRERRAWVFDRRLTTSGISSLAAAAGGFLAGAYDGQVYPIRW